jgi:hypothetical protein
MKSFLGGQQGREQVAVARSRELPRRAGAIAAGQPALAPALLAGLRKRYDEALTGRPWLPTPVST